MTSLVVNFPQYPSALNLGFDNFGMLRAYSQASTLLAGFNAIIDSRDTLGDGLGGIYSWVPSSVVADDNLSVIAPTGYSSGRWHKVGVGGIGPAGPAPTLNVGYVNTLTSGSAATAVLRGSGGAYTLDLGIPAGPTGSGTSFTWGGATGTIANQTDLMSALAVKAPSNNPTFTGVVLAPTPAPDTSNTQIATTAYVVNQGYAKIIEAIHTTNGASPSITVGTPNNGSTGAIVIRANSATGCGILQFTNDIQSVQTAVLVAISSGLTITAATIALSGTATTATASFGTATTQIATTAFVDALRDLPQSSKTAAYTIALADRGTHISISTGGITVPSNATVAFPIGSSITIYNNSSASQTIAITTDTMYLIGTSTGGSRTLAQRGLATLLKVNPTEWVISGTVT